MKNFKLIGLSGALILAMIISTQVFAALVIDNIDGTWSNVVAQNGGNPDCVGIENTMADNTDANIVAYGQLLSTSSCPATSPDSEQSGFEFDGTDGPLTLSQNSSFSFGNFVHFNNPILASNKLASADLTIEVESNGAVYSCTVTVNLDETSNTPGNNPGGVCPYPVDAAGDPVGPGGIGTDGVEYDVVNVDVNGNGEPDCADHVDFEVPICYLNIPDPDNPGGSPLVIEILGFSAGTCDTSDPSMLTDGFTTIEREYNEACVYAQFTLPPDVTPTATPMATVIATSTPDVTVMPTKTLVPTVTPTIMPTEDSQPTEVPTMVPTMVPTNIVTELPPNDVNLSQLTGQVSSDSTVWLMLGLGTMILAGGALVLRQRES